MYLKRSPGFTIIELIVTMAIAAIVLGLVVPSFQNLIRSNQVSTETNALVSALQLARSEAVKLSEDVTVSSDGGDFSDGWCVHSGANCAANPIRQFEDPSASFNAAFAAVSFDRRGELASGGGGNLQVDVRPQGCPSGEAGAQREITIGLGGQIRVARNDCP
jgi:type IV fimbrial biogenesis protein FimT